FGTAVLGLTMDCTRCHDHKFDPLTQRDFYSLSAFFQNIDESGAIPYKNFSDIMPPPVLKLPDDVTEKKLLEYVQQIAAAEKDVAVAQKAADKSFDLWLAKRSGPVPEVEGAVLALNFDALLNGTTPNSAAPKQPAKV